MTTSKPQELKIAPKDMESAPTFEVPIFQIHLTKDQPDDVYGEYTEMRRFGYIILAAFATLILPFSDTAYLPSLPNIQAEFNTSAILVSLTVALFTFLMGLCPLIWGPMSDYYGRKWILVGSLIIYMASSIGCIFPHEIASLNVARACQAIGASSLFIVGSGVVSDVFPPEKRGTAMGIYGIPLLVGPVLGPIIGGAVANSFGWRGVFVLLSILGGLFVVLELVLLSETHPYIVFKKKISKRFPEGTKNPFPTPTFMLPWIPLTFVRIPSVGLLTLHVAFAAASLYLYLIILPGAVSILRDILTLGKLAIHWGLDQLTTGACYVPSGVAGIIASLIGGKFTDYLVKRMEMEEARIVVTLIGTFIIFLGLLGYGWSLNYYISLAAVLIFTCFIGFGFSFAMPGAITYLMAIKKEAAGAMVALLNFGQFMMAGIAILVGTQLAQDIGDGWLMTLMALLVLLSGAPLVVIVLLAVKRVKLNAYSFEQGDKKELK